VRGNAADEIGVLRTPFGGEFAAKGFGEDRLGQVIDSRLGVFDPLFDLVGVDEELFDTGDYLGLLFQKNF